MESLIETDNKPVVVGKVGEVTERINEVVVPQYPIGYEESWSFFKTAVYDLLGLGYTKDEINKIYDNVIENPEAWNEETIRRAVEIEGRTVIDRDGSPEFGEPKFVKKEGGEPAG